MGSHPVYHSCMSVMEWPRDKRLSFWKAPWTGLCCLSARLEEQRLHDGFSQPIDENVRGSGLLNQLYGL